MKGRLKRAPGMDSKLLVLTNCWPDLQNDLQSKSYHGYLQEYASLLKHYLDAASLLDLEISEIRNIVSILIRLTKIDSKLGLDELNKLALKRLAMLYFYVGEVKSGLEACQGIMNREVDMSFEIDDTPGSSEYEYFDAVCKYYETHDSGMHEILIQMRDEWKAKSTSLDYDYALCLFVEKGDSGRGVRGRMRTLKASLELASKASPDDKVSFDNQTKSPDDPFVGSVYNSLKAVRKVIGRYGHKEASKRFYNAHFSIENSKQTFTGDSIGLAAGL
ncbi:MAG TPA: hypothetical protein ENO22_00005, partial [candidate division Zixibacteria bacterium]|nr:hypothetical protein [candidate division Zixibacteria bacterium]